jgi:hypothetical protein
MFLALFYHHFFAADGHGGLTAPRLYEGGPGRLGGSTGLPHDFRKACLSPGS